MKLPINRYALSYEPETVEDQETIDSYGGLDNTPAYLVRLRPVLKVDGDMISGRQGWTANGRGAFPEDRTHIPKRNRNDN